MNVKCKVGNCRAATTSLRSLKQHVRGAHKWNGKHNFQPTHDTSIESSFKMQTSVKKQPPFELLEVPIGTNLASIDVQTPSLTSINETQNYSTEKTQRIETQLPIDI
ncbi:hypothetical protein RF11_02666 [Thelohanellus kitauei]|uniref:Uncharacterized protein n=1 Tax=Thelohanellus kitauei TaxID=669202 RepID=A0A0C2N4N1_THEKT|nr:hypothetical protein RF11_02666 [Thelohanellus kitauei]